MITSKSNTQIRNVRKLIESAKERKDRKLFVVEGKRLVLEAPSAWVEQVFLSESFYSFGKTDLRGFKNIEVVSDTVFKSISNTVHPQGILAVVRKPEYVLKGLQDAVQKEGSCTLLLLDDIQDPGNLGTILRTAEAAGVGGVIMSPGCADIFNPKTIRSTMGSIYRVPFVVDELVSVIEDLKMDGFAIYGAALEGATPFREVDYPPLRAIVIGNEGKGISTSVLNSVTARICIPMKGKVESLNAAVSCAVILYHLDSLT